MGHWQWSKSYYGVQHITNLPKTHQITIEDHGLHVRAFVLALKSDTPFTAIAEDQFESMQRAQAWAEQKADIIAARKV